MQQIALDFTENGLKLYAPSLGYLRYVREVLQKSGYSLLWEAVKVDSHDEGLVEFSVAVQVFLSLPVALTVAEFIHKWAKGTVERPSLLTLKVDGGRWYLKGLPNLDDLPDLN